MYFEKSLCRVSTKKHSAKRFLPSAKSDTRQISSFLSTKSFFAECQIWHYAKTSLPSVSSLPSVDSLALGKELLCRVPEKKHSAKSLALDKDLFSDSVYNQIFLSHKD
jgi:hypothetical protein